MSMLVYQRVGKYTSRRWDMTHMCSPLDPSGLSLERMAPQMATLHQVRAVSLYPKNPFVSPKDPGFYLQSYDLGMGFRLRPSILRIFGRGLDS